jgi:hypothetical protein
MELRWLPWMRPPTLAERGAEMAYIEYKCAFPSSPPLQKHFSLCTPHSRRQEGLWKPHLAAGIFTLCVSLMFSVVFWKNTTLHGTLFPHVYWLQHITYALTGLLELGVSLVMHFAPRFRARHAVFVHFIVALWFVLVLGFDPYRSFRLLDSNTTYAKELGKWVELHSPDLAPVVSCSGYVLDGEQRCYYNSYDTMYSNMSLCVLAITGFYLQLPPYAFLVLMHVATALRAGLVLSLGSANTSIRVDLVELLVFYMILLVIFAGVRRNDKQMRTTFFLQERTAERMQREKERLGWDIHLITKRLEQQISERSGWVLGAPSCMASLPPAAPSTESTGPQAQDGPSSGSGTSDASAPPDTVAVLDEISTAVDEMAQDEREDLVARELVLRVGMQETLAALDAIDRSRMPPPPQPENKFSLREELEQSWLGALLQLGKEARAGTEPLSKQQIRKKRPRKAGGASSWPPPPTSAAMAVEVRGGASSPPPPTSAAMAVEVRGGASSPPPPTSAAMAGAMRAMPELHSPPLQPRAAPRAAVPCAAPLAPVQTEKQRRAQQVQLRAQEKAEQHAREQVRFEEELKKQQQAQQQLPVKQQPQAVELLGSSVGKAVFTDEEEALRKSPES